MLHQDVLTHLRQNGFQASLWKNQRQVRIYINRIDYLVVLGSSIQYMKNVAGLNSYIPDSNLTQQFNQILKPILPPKQEIHQEKLIAF